MAKEASPLARSGLTTAGAGPAAMATPTMKTDVVAAKVADFRKEKIDFMVIVQSLEEGGRKTQGFYNEVCVSFLTTQGIPDL
jgi:hypothetical protein